MLSVDNKKSRFFKEGNFEGEYNFDIKKSEYMPIFTTFDSNTSILSGKTYLKDETYEKLLPNKYLSVFKSFLLNNSLLKYEELRKKLVEKVLSLNESKFSFEKKHLTKSYYLTTYKRFPYEQAFLGRTFSFEGITFGSFSKTLLISCTPNGENIIHYLFTFKSKYIEELQRALIQGKNLKNHWFHVFITPEIPGVNTLKGYKKAFSSRFITPFEEAGIEITYMDNILEKLSFTEIEKTPVFSFKAKTRKNKALEMLNVLMEFRDYELNKFKLQDDWDLGLKSQIKFNLWLTNMKSVILMKDFETFIDDTYYSTISLEEGMRRQLLLGTELLKEQVFKTGKWINNEAEVSQSNFNDLTMKFFALSGMNKETFPESYYSLFATEKIDIIYNLFSEVKEYREINIVYNFDTDYYYEIKDYRVNLKVLSEILPMKVDYSNLDYFYTPAINAYTNALNLAVISAEAENLFSMLYVTTTIEFMANKQLFEDDCTIYFWDVRAIYSKRKGLLYKVVAHSIEYLNDYVVEKITNSNIIVISPNYGESIVESIVKNIPLKLLISNEDIPSNVYFPIIQPISLDATPEPLYPNFIGEQRVNENTSSVEIFNGVSWINKEEALAIGVVILNDFALAMLKDSYLNGNTTTENTTPAFNTQALEDRVSEIRQEESLIQEANVNETRVEAEAETSDEPDPSIFDVEPSNLENMNQESHES